MMQEDKIASVDDVDAYADKVASDYEDALVAEMRKRDEVEFSAASRLSAYLQVPDMAETLSNGEVLLAGALVEVLDRLGALEKRLGDIDKQVDSLEIRAGDIENEVMRCASVWECKHE